jgi:hypothetical protein
LGQQGAHGLNQSCRRPPGNAVLQTIPTGPHIAIQLQLRELDGAKSSLPVDTGAMVLGNEVLLGAIPMQDIDHVLRPR